MISRVIISTAVMLSTALTLIALGNEQQLNSLPKTSTSNSTELCDEVLDIISEYHLEGEITSEDLKAIVQRCTQSNVKPFYGVII